MDPWLIALIAFTGLFTLVAAGVPIGFALGVTAIAGFTMVMGFRQALMAVHMTAWTYCTDWVLLCIPLFILMGQLIFYSGVAAGLYEAVYRWMGRLPGGLAVATTWGCAAFGAVTGSSVAAVATMGSITYPVMKQYNYQPELATGVLAAAGTLGTLIPPSLGMIVYATLTEQSIGRLFIAGVFPGLISAFIYAMMIIIRAKRNPTLGPPGPSFSWRARIEGIRRVWPVVLLFLLVIGGIYRGVFSPTEAAGVGAFFAFVLFVAQRKLHVRGSVSALVQTTMITAMIMVIIIGGVTFSRFLTATAVTYRIVDIIGGLLLNRYIILLLLLGVYFTMGCVLDTIGMTVILIPVIYPIICRLGFDPIWFGVIHIKMTEIALITPPVGANVFVMGGVAPEVPLTRIFRGVIPFVFMDVLTIIILVAFPQISLWLPDTMIG